MNALLDKAVALDSLRRMWGNSQQCWVPHGRGRERGGRSFPLHKPKPEIIGQVAGLLPYVLRPLADLLLQIRLITFVLLLIPTTTTGPWRPSRKPEPYSYFVGHRIT